MSLHDSVRYAMRPTKKELGTKHIMRLRCWPLVPKFAGSNPTEAVGFFRAKKSPARLPSEGK